jgi:hypothetical protein
VNTALASISTTRVTLQYHNIYLKYHSFSILKCMCSPQWSLGKHCVLVTFSIPTKPKWTGATLFGCECRMYARSNRQRGLNLPDISLLQFRTISHVYWHSLRDPHEIHRSSMPGGTPPASSSCKRSSIGWFCTTMPCTVTQILLSTEHVLSQN